MGRTTCHGSTAKKKKPKLEDRNRITALEPAYLGHQNGARKQWGAVHDTEVLVVTECDVEERVRPFKKIIEVSQGPQCVGPGKRNWN